MRKTESIILTIIISLLVCVSVVFMIQSGANGKEQTTGFESEQNEPVKIIGSVQIDGGEWRELTGDTRFDTDAYHTVIIKGHLSRDIPDGQSLLFYIPRLYVSLRADGAELYSFGEDSNGAPPRSYGTVWAEVKAAGLTAGTDIELVMRNTYKNSNVHFRTLLDSLRTGSHAGLYEQMFRENGAILAFGLFFIFISVMALVLAAVAYFLRVRQLSVSVALAVFAVTAAANALFDLNYLYIPLLIPNPGIVSAGDILSLHLTTCAFYFCAMTYAGQRIRKAARLVTVVQCSLVLGLVVLQLLGVLTLYETQPVLLLTTVATIFVAFGVMLYDAIKLKNNGAKIFLLTMLPAFVGGLLDITNYFFSVMPSRVLFSTGLSISLILQIFQVIYMLKRSSDAAKANLQLENELTQSRIAVMLSQIQPHFLYNSLGAIQRLCTKDPKLAEETVIEFTNYLRGNMSSLSMQKPIPFEIELQHVENYLALEKKRFGERLHVVYEIHTTNFTIPVLTLQPIVENAVRHGVTKRDDGGTVTIRTEESDANFIITIADDGVGFEPNNIKQDGQQHIGIENVRSRLTAMCGGTLTIQSKRDTGTAAILTIPKGDD